MSSTYDKHPLIDHRPKYFGWGAALAVAGLPALAPYAAAGKVATFAGTQQLLPGFGAVPGPGHTPGHSFYVPESQGQQLVFWGDLVHATSGELPQPATSFRFDTSRPQTAASRRQAYPDAARQGYRVAINHASFPGIGYVRAVGQGYEWVPINYSLGATGQ